MLAKEFLAIVLISVVLVLLLRNAQNTNLVIGGLGQASTSLLAQLQGGGSGGGSNVTNTMGG